MGLQSDRALQNLVSTNLDLRMRDLQSETIPTSLFFIFIYYQDVIHEGFLIQKALSGISVIDGLFQAYSSHDILVMFPQKYCVPLFLTE